MKNIINIQKECSKIKSEMIEFLQELIRIKSFTGKEKELAEYVKSKMIELDYDNVIETEHGDIVGVIGNGPLKILFDSHMDTVEVTDEEYWTYPPFGGEILEGRIYGRGTVDMKSAIASSVYAGYLAKRLGIDKEKTIYISVSVMEEDFDGYALNKLIDELELKLDYVIICEPSENKIAIGHRGRALFEIHTNGVSAHGSAPENGVNAIYEMNEIISRVKDLNEKLYQKDGEHGSIALTKIESSSVSLNAVPDKCTIYLDRRLAIGETFNIIESELDFLVKDLNASWNVYIAKGESYTGKEVNMYSFMEAWSIDKEDHLSKIMGQAYSEQTKKEPEFFKWNFSTNGFASTARNIPTIGIGPGEIKYCHMRDENCRVDEVVESCAIYTEFIKRMV